MPPTPLSDALAMHDRAPVTSTYRGVTTAARFGDPQEEFRALLNGCGMYDLGFRARLSLTGNDRVRWLNGMVTNNIRDLAAQRGVYTFLLNPQGRILGDMYAYNLGESIVIETDRSQVEKIIATFDHYIIMDDVEVNDISGKHTALGVAGPKSLAILNAAGIEVPDLQPLQAVDARCSCDCSCLECTVMRGEDASNKDSQDKGAQQESYELWLAPEDAFKTWQALRAAGAMPVGSEALELQRIVRGIPLYGVDIRERDLPQETEQMRALNFNKGCYVGQEIVERIRSRGNVHRTFTGFLATGASGIAAGQKIVAGEREVGEITSAATFRAPSGEQTVALGYIRREVGLPGRDVTIGTTTAKVTHLPFDNRAFGMTKLVSSERVPAEC